MNEDNNTLLQQLHTATGVDWTVSDDAENPGIVATYPRFRANTVAAVLGSLTEAGAKPYVLSEQSVVGMDDPNAPSKLVVPEALAQKPEFSAALTEDVQESIRAASLQAMRNSVGTGMGRS